MLARTCNRKPCELAQFGKFNRNHPTFPRSKARWRASESRPAEPHGNGREDTHRAAAERSLNLSPLRIERRHERAADGLRARGGTVNLSAGRLAMWEQAR